MEISQINNLAFNAKLSEAQVIDGVTSIIKSKHKYPFVKKNLNFFKDMQKGSAIDTFRKSEIDEWIKKNTARYANSNVTAEEVFARKHIQNLKEKHMSKFQKFFYKTSQFIGGKRMISQQFVKELATNIRNMKLFQTYSDVFNSYLELKSKSL